MPEFTLKSTTTIRIEKTYNINAATEADAIALWNDGLVEPVDQGQTGEDLEEMDYIEETAYEQVG